METSEIIFSIEWYVKSKNLALKNALAIRCPMSIEEQEELRQYYSHYLSAVLSITELLCDKATPLHNEFKEKLYLKLNCEHSNKCKYYDYLRELRNSVVHRGIDLTASAHIVNDFPLLLAPPTVTNRSGKEIHESPEKYFFSIIKHLETVVPNLVLNHIKENGWNNNFIASDKSQEEFKQMIVQSEAMPEWIKQKTLQSITSIDMHDIKKQRMNLALKNIGITLALPKII